MSVPMVKHCVICGAIISDLSVPGTSYHSHIRKKYCDDCRKVVWGQQMAVCKDRYRERQRIQKKALIVTLAVRNRQVEVLKKRLMEATGGEIVWPSS